MWTNAHFYSRVSRIIWNSSHDEFCLLFDCTNEKKISKGLFTSSFIHRIFFFHFYFTHFFFMQQLISHSLRIFPGFFLFIQRVEPIKRTTIQLYLYIMLVQSSRHRHRNHHQWMNGWIKKKKIAYNDILFEKPSERAKEYRQFCL